MSERVPLDAPMEKHRHGAITGTERTGAHEMIDEAEALARLLRVVSGGNLSLAVVDNHGRTLREREGMGWGEAHEVVERLYQGKDPEPKVGPRRVQVGRPVTDM